MSSVPRHPTQGSSTPDSGQKTVEAKPPTMASTAMAWRARAPATWASAMLAGVLRASVVATPMAAQHSR